MTNRSALGAVALIASVVQGVPALAAGHSQVISVADPPGHDMADEALRHVGEGNITGRRGPWCKWFVNYVAKRTGHYASSSGWAIDVHGMGSPTYPHRGAIAYNSRHTMIVLGVEGHTVVGVSGNNHARRVGISRFPVWAFRYVQPFSQYAMR